MGFRHAFLRNQMLHSDAACFHDDLPASGP
ncbi:hypothetical protein GGD67_002781 [Bradyrhizobium sp. IAR9]|nr:hypothetical protein [Bradyrhizobium sp. IAR9]